MSVSNKLLGFLEDQHIRYVAIKHLTAYTAQEIAASLHVPGDVVAKTVIVRIDGTMAMVVLPACYHIDFDALKKGIGCRQIELATEGEFHTRFPDCEPGAMPPFGNLYEMPVYVARSLSGRPEIVFNAGAHNEAIRMPYLDFEQLVHPQVLSISQHN